MYKGKGTLWRFLRWVLGIIFALAALNILVVLIISYTYGPRPKAGEEWQAYLVLAIELVLCILSWSIFKSLRRKKPAEDPQVYSARQRGGQVVPHDKKRFDERNPRFVAFFEALRIRGIGIDYLTFFNQQEDGTVYASRWFMFGFLPIIPISVDRIHMAKQVRRVHIPFLLSSSKLYETRIEIHDFPRQLKRLSFLQAYALLLPGMLALSGLFIWYLVHPSLGFHHTPAWVYLLVFGGFVGLVIYNEYWHQKRFLRRSFGGKR